MDSVDTRWFAAALVILGLCLFIFGIAILIVQSPIAELLVAGITGLVLGLIIAGAGFTLALLAANHERRTMRVDSPSADEVDDRLLTWSESSKDLSDE